MTKTVTRMLASMAALSLAATPIVAEAKTRAGDSSVTYSAPKSKPGAGREAKGEGLAAIAVFGILIAVTPAVFATLLAAGAIDSDGNCISPAACPR